MHSKLSMLHLVVYTRGHRPNRRSVVPLFPAMPSIRACTFGLMSSIRAFSHLAQQLWKGWLTLSCRDSDSPLYKQILWNVEPHAHTLRMHANWHIPRIDNSLVVTSIMHLKWVMQFFVAFTLLLVGYVCARMGSVSFRFGREHPEDGHMSI